MSLHVLAHRQTHAAIYKTSQNTARSVEWLPEILHSSTVWPSNDTVATPAHFQRRWNRINHRQPQHGNSTITVHKHDRPMSIHTTANRTLSQQGYLKPVL